MSFTDFTEMLAEIGEYIYEKYICLNLSLYKNFDLGARNTTVAMIVLCFVVGGMVSAILYYRSKRAVAPLVNALLKQSCHSEDSAKSAEALGVRMRPSLCRQMRKLSPLSKVVYYSGQQFPPPPTGTPEIAADAPAEEDAHEESSTPPEKSSFSYKELMASRREIDFTTVPLYIPSSLTYRAEIRFAEIPRLRTLILVLILFPILGFAVLRFFPDLLLAADALITFFS